MSENLGEVSDKLGEKKKKKLVQYKGKPNTEFEACRIHDRLNLAIILGAQN